MPLPNFDSGAAASVFSALCIGRNVLVGVNQIELPLNETLVLLRGFCYNRGSDDAIIITIDRTG